MGYPDIAAACNASFITGQKSMQKKKQESRAVLIYFLFSFCVTAFYSSLWNGDYFAAFSGGKAVMADTLYGQVWAYTLGLGAVFPENYLR
jgi:uncharacterized protein (DUF608 family)